MKKKNDAYRKFCPKCGKGIASGTFCMECAGTAFMYKPVRIKICPSGKYFFKGKWTHYDDLRKVSEKLVKEAVRGKAHLVEGLESFPDLVGGIGSDQKVDIIVESGGQEFKIPVQVDIELSPGVRKFGGSYFEGVLQLRNATKESKDYVKRYIARNSSRDVFVNKVVETENSADYYFVHKRNMMPLALKLMRNFGGYIDANPKLFSYDHTTSRDLYRLNLLVVFANFTIGDVVVFNEMPLYILGLGKIINSLNLSTGNRFTFSFEHRNQDSFKVLERKKTTVSLVKPSLEVIHPTTYQSVSALNPLGISVSQGKKVTIVEHEQKYYLVK